MSLELRVVGDAEAAAYATAEELARAAAAGGHLSVAGGSTPRRAYELAAELEPDWSGAELWWGDERCVPHDDSRSNYRLVREALLERVSAQPRAHPVETDRPPADAAEAYDSALAGVELDLALLGLGPDGHTASLFPNAPALEEKGRRAVAADPGLEPWVPRVTMTVPLLSSAKLVLFLAVGDEKAEAAARAFGAPPSPAVPASLIRSGEGRTVFILDQAAADNLPNVA